MTHVSLRSARHKQNHQQEHTNYQRTKRSWLRGVRWIGRLPAAFKSKIRQRRLRGKNSLDQLNDHELRDIGLTREFPGRGNYRRKPGEQYGESEYLHKGLRDLQHDLIRYLPRDY